MNFGKTTRLVTNSLTLLILGSYLFALVFVLWNVGLGIFQKVSATGLTFYLVQAVLIGSVIAMSVPLARWGHTGLSIGRLVLSGIMLLLFVLMAGVSDGFRT